MKSSVVLNLLFVLFFLQLKESKTLETEENLHEGLDQFNSRLVSKFELHSKLGFIQQVNFFEFVCMIYFRESIDTSKANCARELIILTQ